MPPRPRTRLSTRKRIAFALLALALPIVAVALVELGLRWAGYGGYGSTYHVAATGADGRELIAVTNDRVNTFFFRNRDLPGQLNPTYFFEPKAEGTVRVMIVGESAIKGFPQPPALTAAAFLDEMLADALPGREVEVINLGTTAIASYPILEIGVEALAHDPDVLIVQAGNNEFFGAFGVASLNRAGNSPGAIAAQRIGKSLALVQWAGEVFAKMRAKPAAPTTSSATLMERMIGRDYTGPDDPIRDAAARNIRTHLRTLIRRCEARGVPVVVCLTGVNERGMAPLGQSRIDGLAPADTARFEALMALDPEKASDHLDDLRWAVATLPEHARAHWLLATALHARGEFAEAQRAFQRAINLDPMPWRAPSAVLDAARSALDGTSAVLADAAPVLRAASEGGSIGWDLMVDHVHMSVLGQDLTARVMFDGLSRVPALGIGPDASARLAPHGEYLERLGATPFDIYGGYYRMFRLLQVPFFEQTNPWAAGIMAERMRELEMAMSPNEFRAVEAWKEPKNSLDFLVPVSAFVGEVCMAEQRYDQGERVYRAATRNIAPYTHLSLEFTYRWLGCRMRAAGGLDPEHTRIAQDAIGRGELMLSAADTSAPPLHRYVGSLKSLLGDCVGAVPHLQQGRYGYGGMDLVQVDAQIVDCLVKMGRMTEARQIVEYGIAHAGPMAPAYQQMAGMLEARPSGTP